MPNLPQRFAEYLTAVKGRSPKTVTTYMECLDAFSQYWQALDEELTWETLDTDILRAWAAERMAQGNEPTYVRKMLSAVRSFYRYLLQEGIISRDPMHRVTSPKVAKRLPTFVRESEMNRLFDEIEFGEDYIGIRNRTILLMLYHTGIRAAELLGLHLADIDHAGQSLKVTGKRNKQRIVPFGNELREALLIYIRAREEYIGTMTQRAAESGHSYTSTPACFLNARGRALTYPELRVLVHDALALVSNQKRLSPHVLRHSFATTMLSNGASLEAIQKLLGHANLATTEIYTHATVAHLKDEYAAAHPRG